MTALRDEVLATLAAAREGEPDQDGALADRLLALMPQPKPKERRLFRYWGRPEKKDGNLFAAAFGLLVLFVIVGIAITTAGLVIAGAAPFNVQSTGADIFIWFAGGAAVLTLIAAHEETT